MRRKCGDSIEDQKRPAPNAFNGADSALVADSIEGRRRFGGDASKGGMGAALLVGFNWGRSKLRWGDAFNGEDSVLVGD